MAPHHTLQLPNICGLFWLLGDRRRTSAPIRISATRELQQALHLAINCGVLEALAHLTLELAQDISLHTVGWKQARRPADLCELDCRHGPWRPLAWCRLELLVMGSDARRIIGRRETTPV